MEKRVIDVTAASPIANKYDTLVKGEILITGLTSAVSYPTSIQATRTDIEIGSNLSGYGEEAISNYGNLFVRPSQWLNIAEIQEAAAKQYLKPVSFQTNSDDINTKLIAVANNFIINASEEFITKNEFLRSIVDGGLDQLYFGEDYLELFGTDYIESLRFIFFTDERYIDLNKAFNNLVNTDSLDSKLVESAKLELVNSSEIIDKVYAKSVLELITASDDFYGLANLDDDQVALVIKAVLEDVFVSQRFSIVLDNVYSDISILTELNTKNIESLKLDSLQALEQVIKVTDFKRLFDDTAVTTDDFLGNANLDDDQVAAVVKVLSNEAFVLEQKRVNLSSVLSAQLVISNELHTSLLNKAVNELITATDDFYGAANLDDDLFAVVIKGVIETSVVSEVQQYLVDYKRLFVDVPVALESAAISTQKTATTDYLQNVSDVTSLQPNKGIIEESFFFDRYVREDFVDDNRPNSTDDYKTFELLFNLLDSPAISTSIFKVNADKVLSSQAVNLDEYRSQLTTPKFEQSIVSDNRLILTNKNVLEQTLTSQLFKLILDKSVLETISLPELLAFDTHKKLESLVSATDDFYGLANLDDDQIATVTKVLHDTVITSESFDARYTPSTPVNDSSLLIDEFLNSFIKVREDTFVNTDLKYFVNEKVLESEVTSVVEQKFNIETVLVDAYDWFAYDYTTEAYTLGGAVAYDEPTKQLQSVLTPSTISGVYETDPVFHAYKRLVSSVVNTEVASFALEFNLADYLIATDDFYGLANLDDDQIASFNKVLHDTTNGTPEVRSFNTQKVLLSTSYLNEISNKDIYKVLQDQVLSTDDFYGLANIDDDQIATVGKVLSSTLFGTTDTFTRLLVAYKSFTDTSVLGQEVKVFNTLKDFGYSAATSYDEKSFSSSTVRQDAFAPIESAAKDVSKLLIDNNTYVTAGYSESIYAVTGPFIVDQAYLGIAPSVIEVITLTETYLDFNTGKGLVEVLPTSQEVSKELLFNLLDNFNTTDDFYGLANVDDDQTAIFLKLILDPITLVEQPLVYQVGKGLVNTVPVIEAPEFNLQTVRADLLVSQQEVRNAVTKTLSDGLATNEFLTLLLVQGRTFLDLFVSAEQSIVSFSKVTDDDTTSVADSVLNKTTEKLVLNQVDLNTQQLFYADIDVVLIDKPEWFSYDYTTDAYTLGGAVTYDLNYFNLSIVAATEYTNLYTNIPVFDSNKVLVDSTTATEQINRTVIYNRSYYDTALVTDDFLGAANLDDDQYVYFVKVLVEATNTSQEIKNTLLKTTLNTSFILDQPALNNEKILSDSTNSSLDQKEVLLSKVLNSNIATAEYLTLLLIQGRFFADFANISQQVRLVVNKLRLEEVTGNDLSVIVYDKFEPELITYSQELTQNYGKSVIGPDFFLEVYSDGYTKGGVATAEYAYKLFNKPIANPETINIADTSRVLVNKTKLEQATATQTLVKLNLQKTRLDTSTVAELTQKVIAKAKTEAIVSQEQATALIENYFPPQFAQVGYVGTNFTL